MRRRITGLRSSWPAIRTEVLGNMLGTLDVPDGTLGYQAPPSLYTPQG
jgi:hypothetical protein